MVSDRYTDYGQDVTARVNGMTVQGNGLRISPRGSVLNADITLTTEFATQTAASATFYVTGGGANFAITPQLDGGSIARIGLNAVTTASLGDRNTGLLFSLGTGEANALSSKRFKEAQDIVRLAATQIAELRGRLGSFQKSTLDTTENSLMVTFENVSSAESQIRDADFAAETSNLTRSQILVQSAGLVLANTNRAPQNVLQLLQQ
jgi:flagellin